MTRRRLVLILDWLVLALSIAAVVVDLTGGFYIRPGGVRISMQRTDRVVFTALAVFLLRLRIGRGISPLGGRLAGLRRLRDRLFNRAADPRSAPSVPSLDVRRFLLATGGFVAIGAVLLHTQLAHMDSVPDLGDPLFSLWRMAWVFHQLGGDPRPLFDANIFHPEPLTLTYSDSMLLPALTGAPLLAAGLRPVIAYNVLFLSGFLFSAMTTYLLVARVTGSSRAAFVGGLIYGFYPYRFEHYSHLELQMTYWMPLGLLALHRFSETLKVRDAVLLALCGVAQLYSSMYYGVFFPLYAAAILGTLFALSRPGWRRALTPLAIAGAIAVALAVPLARPYFAAQPVKGERDINTVTFYSATASDYFRAHPRSALYGGRLLSDDYPERALFPGVSPLVLTAVALVPPLGVTRVAYLAGLLFAFDLSEGFNGRSYSYLYDWFVPIRGMRVPARVSAILAISLAMLGAFGARRVLHRCRGDRARTIVFAVMVAAVSFDLHPDLQLQRVWPEPPPIYSAVASEPDVVLAEIPFSTRVPGVTDNVQYMYFSLWHWRSMVNGYSGFTTSGYQQLRRDVADFPGPVSIAALHAHGVTHVSVNCAFLVEGCEALLETLENRPDFSAIASGRWQGSSVRLYKLAR